MIVGKPEPGLETPIPRHLFRSGITRSTLLKMALGVVLALICFRVAFDSAGDVSGAVDALGEADLRWVPVALLAELLCYLFIGFQLQRLSGPSRISFWVAARVGVVASGLGSLLPGTPAPGIALGVHELSRRGRSARESGLSLVWLNWFSIRAFLVTAALAAVIALFRGNIAMERAGLVITGVAVIGLGLIVTSILLTRKALMERAAVFIGRARFWAPKPTDAEARATGAQWYQDAMDSLGSNSNRMLIGGASILSWLADAWCLRFALLAVGAHIDFNAVLLAYTGASLASSIKLIPGGLGIVEATQPLILHHFHVPLDIALAGTLAWRGFSLVLPAVVGAAALVSLRLGAGAMSDRLPAER